MIRQVYRDLVERTAEDDESIPQTYGPYLYSSRLVKGSNYPIIQRRAGRKSQPKTILNLNLEARGHAFLDLGTYRVTRSGDSLFFTLDRKGDERYTLFYQDLRKSPRPRQTLETAISANFEISPNGRYLYFLKEDATRRPYQVWMKDREAPKEKPRLVYEEKDQRFYVGLDRTKDEAFILILLESKKTAEVRLIDW